MFVSIIAVSTMAGCVTSNKIKSGIEAFQLKRYAVSVPLLTEEYQKAKNNAEKAEIAKMIAIALDQQNKYMEAEEWYKNYRELSVEQEAPLAYAKALMRNEKYAEAKTVLEQYLKVNRQDRKIVEPLIQTCDVVLNNGEEEMKLVKITPFNGNTESSDFDANIIGDKIIFSSTRAHDAGTPSDWNHENYTSLWSTDLKGQSVEKYKELNEQYHIASLTMTADGKTMYFTQCGSDEVGITDYCGIYRIKKDNDTWSEPERISIWGDTTNNGQAFISPDGKMLYFSSDAPFGYGGKDLYQLSIQKDGSYGEPVNLGSRVNTPFDEMFPFVTDDGNTLYYSSNNLQSFGGLDIFKATKVGRLFTNAERLPYGLNTGRDDFALEIFPQEENADTTLAFKGIFSSNRKGTGSDDLYFVELTKAPPKVIPPAMYIFEGVALENIYADSLNPNSKVIGQKPVPYPIVTLSGQNISADEEGFFTAQLDSGFAYLLRVQKDGYLSVDIPFNTVQVKSNPGDTIYFRQRVVLSKIYKDVEIVLDNIYYDFDKWDIREDAKPTLDSLVNILNQNPKISIELASHTDCRGNDEYNMNLSQKRAESVVKYLISKGIDSKRLTARGYGESMLIDNCPCEVCTEEQHQRNRRTTFKIINIQ